MKIVYDNGKTTNVLNLNPECEHKEIKIKIVSDKVYKN